MEFSDAHSSFWRTRLGLTAFRQPLAPTESLALQALPKSPFLATLALFIWTAAAFSAPDPEPGFAEATVARYEALSSYCDEAEVTWESLGSTFTRCFTKDGRYKVSEQVKSHWRNQRTRWGDRAKAYGWYGYRSRLGFRRTSSYTEESPPSAYSASSRPQGLTAGVLQLFRLDTMGDRARIVRMLANYSFVREAEGLRIYEYHYQSPAGTEITHLLWVRQSDGMVVGAQENWGNVVQRAVRLSSVRLDPPLERMDLAYVPPLGARFANSLVQRPVPTAAGMAVFAFVAGFLGWVGIAATTGRVMQSDQWRMIWKRYLFAAALGALAVGLLYLLVNFVAIGEGIIYVLWIVDTPFVGIGFLTLAMFLLGGHTGSWLASRRFVSGKSASVD